jgi:hypothetical protein
MRIKAMKTSILILSTLLFSISAHAQEAGKPLAEKLKGGKITINTSVRGCDADIKQHCAGLGKNAQKVFMCLAAYEDQLSQQCKQGISEATQAIKTSAAALDYSLVACEADADKHCLAVEPGQGRMLRCIKANQSEISQQCLTALKDTGLWDLVE